MRRARSRLALACAAALSGLVVLAQGGVADTEGRGGPSPLAVNLALTATATASSETAAAPAANAIDGDGSTAWCPATDSGSLVVDLGRVARLEGVGLTLATPATVSVAVAREAGEWLELPDASFTAGVPGYIAAPSTARYARLSVTGAGACVGEFRLFGRAASTARMAFGADLSFQRQELAAGTVFTDLNGSVGTPMEILQDHGLNYVRLRLWTSPPPGYSDLANDLAVAREVKKRGLKLLLDLHYSDFWADPGHQNTPAAWASFDLPTLVSTVNSYTEQVIAAFAAQGTPVDMVSIGNEIRHGILWPLGWVDDGNVYSHWDNLAALLKAGVAGAKAGNPEGHRLRIMLHIDHGANNAESRDFFDRITALGVPFDTIGLSFYTFWDGPLSALRANLNDVAARYGKPVFVAELQYPWTLANGDSTPNFVWTPSQLPAGYPASPAGQLSFVNDVLSILAQVPNGRGGGLFYWEPEWVPGVGWEPGAGTPNDNLTLFDFSAHALPSIGIYESPVPHEG